MNFVTVDLILFPIKNEDILPTGEISILQGNVHLKTLWHHNSETQEFNKTSLINKSEILAYFKVA